MSVSKFTTEKYKHSSPCEPASPIVESGFGISMKAASVALLLLPLFPSVSRSQSPFDGTWVIDTSKNENLANEKPTTFLLSDGLFRSGDKVLKANGRDQKVPATGYWDTVSVRIVDDHAVEVTSKKAGKVMFTETDTVSPDGSTLIQVIKDTTEAEAVIFENLYTRVRPAPPGRHVLSGTWKVFKESRSENSTIITYKCTPQGFSAETPLGERFDARFDGKFYLIEDDPAHTMVSVKLINPYTVEQTNKRDARSCLWCDWRSPPDGKTIHASSESKADGSVKTWELHKKPN